MYYTVLYCSVLYSIALNVLYYNVLHCTVLVTMDLSLFLAMWNTEGVNAIEVVVYYTGWLPDSTLPIA